MHYSSQPTLSSILKDDFFQLIAKSINDVIGITDRDGNILYLSENCLDMFGYDASEIVGHSIFDSVCDDDRDLLLKEIEQLVRSELNNEMSISCKYKHKNGTTRYIQMSGRNLLNNQLVNGLLMTFHDQTKQMLISSEKEEITRQYEAMIESTGQMVWSVDVRDFGLKTFNSYMAKYYKSVLNIDLKIGLTPKDMLPENRLEFWTSLYKKVLKDGPQQVSYPMISTNKVLTISLNTVKVNNEVVGISVFTRDDTELTNATNKIKEEIEKYKALIDNMHDYVFIINAGDYTYQLYNSAHADFIRKNYGAKLSIGSSSITYLTDEAKEFWLKIFDDVKTTGHCEFERTSFLGNSVIRFKVHLLDFGKDNQKVMVFGEDITAESEYQTELMNAKSNLININNELLHEFEKAISALSKLGEIRDPYTAGHQFKVQALASAIAEKMSLSDDQKRNIKLGALVHDIGKVYVPSDILSKAGKISDLEFSLIKTHCEFGYRIVKEIDCDPIIYSMVLQHHERLDGSGYPNHLKGDEILLESKILTVADVVEAMNSHRPYRAALGLDKALEEITSNKGTQFDPQIVDICVDLFRKDGFKFPEVNL